MKTTYFLNPIASEEMINAGTNKIAAKTLAKETALAKKRSVTLYRRIGNDLIYIGIAEFPYYLRDLELTTSDIGWNE